MSGAICDVCTRRNANLVCLCLYPCTRLCNDCIGTHLGQTASSHSLEPVAALNLIKNRGDIPAYIARQQFIKEVSASLSANLTAFKNFKAEAESMFMQLETYKRSKLSEIAAAERTLTSVVSECDSHLKAVQFSPNPQARNRFEQILSQSATMNIAEVQKELNMFSATFGQPAQFMRMLDSAICIAIAPGINKRATGQIMGPPQCAPMPGAGSAQSGDIGSLQKALNDLRMECDAKDQTLMTVKNNRDELKVQYAEKRQEYECTIKELERRVKAGGDAGPSHLQDTIQDLKDERRRLLDEKKQYEEALMRLKAERTTFMQKLSELENAKSKVEKDAVMMAMILREKLPEMENQVKAASSERDDLSQLRDRLERLFGSLPVINVGCLEGQAVRKAQGMIREQKTGQSDASAVFIRLIRA